MALSAQPTNQSLAQASKFLLSFDRLPQVSWFCTKVNIPGMSVGNATQVTPFVDAPIPGDKIQYEPLNITFLLDEPLLTWTTIQLWMFGYAFPDNFQQYANLSLQQKLQMANMTNTKPQYSDAILTIFSNKNNPIFQVKFTEVFPVSLSSIDWDTSLSAEFIMTGSASFKFTNYTIDRTIVPQS
jgi:hypothetical protein